VVLLVGPRPVVAELVFALAGPPLLVAAAMPTVVVAGPAPVVPTLDEVEGAVVPVEPAVGPPSLVAFAVSVA
jgi:hypothetical protein